jgi:ATP-dependent DNA helicase RecQ
MKNAVNKEHAEKNPDPHDILRTVFGYESFRGEQKEIISHLISGQSCCVLMPTGSGKSLCYQIPALCREGVGIVVSPLIALMNDQVSALRELGVRAASIHSGLEPSKISEAFGALRSGALDLVYVSPERLVMDDFLGLLDDLPLALFAIDEAHCISQWGHDFRPEYQQLSLLSTRYPDVPRIAVTATADAPTRQEIMDRLNLPVLYTAGFDRPNISYAVNAKKSPEKQLLAFLQTRPADESGIVYCLSRRKVDDTARSLTTKGYKALPYHAGLESAVRADHQNRFLKEEGVIMVATIAFGMGINKPDIRFVAHLDLPKNIEAYYQETGRAGRDGLPAAAWMIYGMQDVALRRQMIENGDSPELQKRVEIQKLNTLLGYCETVTCRRRLLLQYFGDTGTACGNCDTCLHPPKTFDGTIAAQKALSCIYRTDQKFGAAYIIDVLLGTEDERIRKFGHDKLSTFGIGKEHSRKEWQGIIRQLLSRNFLYADMNAHNGLEITDLGREFLKNKNTIHLRLAEKPVTLPSRKTRQGSPEYLENETDAALFQKLKALRLSIACEHNLPPYVIFHDKTLMEMALSKPATLEALAHINGVGESKLKKYGPAFLQIIKDQASA